VVCTGRQACLTEGCSHRVRFAVCAVTTVPAVTVTASITTARSGRSSERDRGRGGCVGQLLHVVLLENDVGENVGKRDDAAHAIFSVNHDQAMHFLVDDAFHDCAQCFVFCAFGHAVESIAPVFQCLNHRNFQVVVRLFSCQIDHVEFRIDIDEPVVLVHDGQRRDSRRHENVQRFGDGRRRSNCLYGAVRAHAELADWLLQKVRLRHVMNKKIEIAQDTLVCDNADHIAVDWVDNGQTMHTIFGQHSDRVEERVLGPQINEGPTVLFEHLSPRVNLVLLELLDFCVRLFVVLLQDENKVGDGEHADELLILAVP